MKILLIMPVSIGDVVLTTPTIEAIKRKYPGCLVHYAVQKGVYSEILASNPHIDNLILLEGDYLREISLGNFKSRLISELPNMNTYDQVINFRDEDGAIKEKYFKGQHAAHFFAKKAGVKLDSIQPRIYFEARHESEAVMLLEGLPRTSTSRRIVVAPYSGFKSTENSIRKWNIDNFIFLMNELGTDHDTQFIVVGAKMDQPIERPSTVNLMGYDLRTIASIISNCDLFIGLDSGITHIASGFNVPIVDILFPALPQYWRPANGRHVVFSSRKVMRKFSAADDLDKEIVLKFCRLLIGENPLNGGTLVRFYPNMRKVVKRFFNHVLLRLSRSLI